MEQLFLPGFEQIFEKEILDELIARWLWLGRMINQPSQGVPPSVSGEGQSQKGYGGSPRSEQTNFPFYNFVQHYEARPQQDEIREQIRDDIDRRRLRVEKMTLVVGFFGVIGLAFTLNETSKATRAAVEAADAAKVQAMTAQGQLKEMQESAVDTRTLAEAAKVQAASAEKLADAAIQSVKVSKQAMSLPNRPWLILQPFSRPILDAARETTITITLKNVGRSPALGVLPCWRTFPDEALPTQTALQCTDAERNKLEPLRSFTTTVPEKLIIMPFIVPPLGEEAIRAIRERKKVIYLYGEVSYQDFAQNDYWTTFCFFITGAEDGTFSPCSSGNVIK